MEVYRRNYRPKTVFPHRYSMIFYKYWWNHNNFWKALTDRLKLEKDAMILVTGDTGCQPKGSKVLMSNGSWKSIEEINVGDEVISPQYDGTNRFSKVLETKKWYSDYNFDVMNGNRKLYSCSWNHIIPFYYYYVRKNKDGVVKKDWGFKEYQAKSVFNMNSQSFKHRCLGFSSFGIEKYENSPNFHLKPYILGSLVSHSIMNQKLLNILPEMSYNEYFKFKTIPKNALLSDLEYRKEILAGILDYNSTFIKNNFFITSNSLEYLESVKDLVCSIGGKNKGIKRINKLDKDPIYKLGIYLGDVEIPLRVKKDLINGNGVKRKANKISISLKETSPGEVYGFELDSSSGLYITDNWMVTHNSGKSHFVGTFCFKHAEKTPNFILNDGSMMFNPEENFIISPEEFAYKMITKEGEVLWGDEFRRGANRRDWYSPINKSILDRKNLNRKLFNIYFLCMPLESEFDPKLASHLHIWIWIRRGVGEIYVKRSGIKGGRGLNIQDILDREAKYLKENPKKTFVPPVIHPEYCGRIAFAKLQTTNEKRYKRLVEQKKATGELTDEEKIKYGIKIEKSGKQIVNEVIEKIKKGELNNKKDVWEALQEINDTDEKKVKLLNFYLNLEGWDNFNKLFSKSKLETEDIW